ncbi:MAG: EscR/YscR/HrcR family type III secretion system export apparatus protein [Salinarimonadaceae bacterium]|nr:MAG: EscR/YscR/HrcR family type III secretion system export apparatus protein [Salinarimonadaceae bacterium]
MTSFAIPSYFSLLIFSAIIAVIPFLVVAATSFAKISIVLFLVRNALGIQQTPPGVLINTVAIVLTMFIMAPVLREIYAILTDPGQSYETIQDLEEVFELSVAPLKAFLEMHSRPEAKEFFVDTTTQLWAANGSTPGITATPDDLAILLPAFLVSELTRAFEIGFLLYLPFLVIDFVVSVIIVAMGMSMLSPTVISTPLKLLLFVFIDGWSRLLQGLVLSYVPGG